MKTYLALAVCALSACATPAPKGQPSISEIAAQFKFREVKKVERVNIVVHRDADVQKTCLPIVGQASLACAVPDT